MIVTLRDFSTFPQVVMETDVLTANIPESTHKLKRIVGLQNKSWSKCKISFPVNKISTIAIHVKNQQYFKQPRYGESHLHHF